MQDLPRLEFSAHVKYKIRRSLKFALRTSNISVVYFIRCPMFLERIYVFSYSINHNQREGAYALKEREIVSVPRCTTWLQATVHSMPTSSHLPELAASL